MERKCHKMKRKTSKILITLLVVGGIVLGAFIGILSFFLTQNNAGVATGIESLSNYIAIFSILITMISILIPVSSYFVNKDEAKRLNDSFDEKTAQIGAHFERLEESVQDKIQHLDNAQVELLEYIVKEYNVSYDEGDDSYYKANLNYIGALLLFQNGSYDESRAKVRVAVEELQNLSAPDAGDSEETLAKTTLLVYKSFNLYRKLSGRTRAFPQLLGDIERFIAGIGHNEAHRFFPVLNYVYIKARLDNIEKNFFTDKAFDDLLSKIDFFRSTTLYEDKVKHLQHSTLMARFHYIRAYYLADHESKSADYAKSLEFAKKACDCLDALRENQHKGEYERLIENDCKYAIVRILEKISFCFPAEQRKEILALSHREIQQLIEQKKEPRYYLELSEILKKTGKDKQGEADQAALYGYLLSPTDPLLAAQCAYIYLREYLKNGISAYLIKAEDCIAPAYWIYTQERSRYAQVNVKFSYIASLYAVIKCYILKLSAEGGKDTADTVNMVLECIDNSIKDNRNNVPNYRRAIMLYILILRHRLCGEDKAGAIVKRLKTLVVQFQKNPALVFRKGEAFYSFSECVHKISPDTASDDELIAHFSFLLDDPAAQI